MIPKNGGTAQKPGMTGCLGHGSSVHCFFVCPTMFGERWNKKRKGGHLSNEKIPGRLRFIGGLYYPVIYLCGDYSKPL